MTVLEASNELYSWFSENDTFCLDKDFIKVIAITETPEEDKAAFLCALKDFEKSKLILSSEINSTEYWILNKKFYSYAQNVQINPELALALAGIINKFCEVIGDSTDLCDPANVEEKDIKNLIYITNVLVSEKKGVDSEQELD
jgi:hypothetical protein